MKYFFSVFLTLTILFLTSPFVFAQNDYGLSQTGTNLPLKVNKPGDAPTKVAEYVGSIINFFLSAIGLIFLILVIYGGFLWLTSAGDSNKVSKGRSILIWAVIGLVVVMSAYLITSFIIASLVPVQQ